MEPLGGLIFGMRPPACARRDQSHARRRGRNPESSPHASGPKRMTCDRVHADIASLTGRDQRVDVRRRELWEPRHQVHTRSVARNLDLLRKMFAKRMDQRISSRRIAPLCRDLFYRAITSPMLIAQFEKMVKASATALRLPVYDWTFALEGAKRCI
jgi:hypothetical protein